MQLPLELLEVIIKQLAGSRSTVRACTLVCSAWSSAALHVLFHDFTLQVAGSGGIHAGLAFPHYVSRLVIRGSYGYDQSIHLRDVLRLFDHATTIRVSFVRSAQLTPLLPRTFPHLRHLDLFVVSFPDARSLHALVATFPDLERLSLSDIETEGIERVNDHPGALPSPPCFRTLVYINSNQRRVPFLRQLSAWHPPTLQHLTLLNILSDELESIGALLHSLGQHLRSLDISFKGAPTPTQVAYLHFPSRICLHTLQISLGHMHHNLGLKIPLALLEADAPALRCIVLELPWDSQYNNRLDAPEWDTLDTLLSHHAPALECFHAYLYDPCVPARFSNKNNIQRLVRARMPLCIQNGVFTGIDFLDGRGTKPQVHG